MAERKQRNVNRLTERMVRNDDIFCSLLFDHANRTIRVVDFRGGNFQNKHNYLESVLLAEGMRKIFTLIERDDMNGWQRVGYIREGTIPGYYKRSDAYIMSRIYDEDWENSMAGDDAPERKAFLADAKTLGKEMAEIRGSGIKGEQVEEADALAAIKAEMTRLTGKGKKGKDGKGSKSAAKPSRPAPTSSVPLFRQFSREIEHFYWIAQNRRSKQLNVFGAEYQDCFGNAKVSMYFTPDSRAGRTVARQGLDDFIDWLSGIGAVAIFALARADDLEQNAIYASAGFRNSGWMNRQLLTSGAAVDQVLWTKKLT